MSDWPWWASFIFSVIGVVCILFALILVLNHVAELLRLQIIKRNDALRDLEKVWHEAYSAGVHDEVTSKDWTDGQYPPKRQNPYTEKVVK